MTTQSIVEVFALIGVISGLWFVWRHYSIPQTSVFLEVRHGFSAIQKHAVHHVDIVKSKVPQPLPRESRFLVGKVASFAYSVEEVDGRYVHLFSGKLLRWRPKRWLIGCMLTSILEFERQFNVASITIEKGMKNLNLSPTGTVFVQYVLTPEQHNGLVAMLNG